MNLEKILAISGKPGLFELKLQTRTGFLAESLLDGKKITVGMRNNVSLLSEISVYTYSEEKPLMEVLTAIAEKENYGAAAITGKENNTELVNYFLTVVPDYDVERVYASDIKKIVTWYNLLQSKGFISKDEVIENAEEIKEEVVKEVKSKKKA